MNLEDYPYKSRFYASVKTVEPSFREMQLAKASIDNLRDLLPADIDVTANPDFLYFTGKGFNGGLKNLNDDSISKETALRVYNCKNKYIDVDHAVSDIVGTVLYSALSRHGSNEIISAVEAMREPFFDISLIGIVWRVVNRELVKLLISDSSKVSLSWEIYYKNFEIAIGSDIVEQAEIITDPARKEELKEYLRSNGGTGYYQGKSIYRVICGPECVISGLGLVKNPAGAVGPISVIEGGTLNPVSKIASMSEINETKPLVENKRQEVLEILPTVDNSSPHLVPQDSLNKQLTKEGKDISMNTSANIPNVPPGDNIAPAITDTNFIKLPDNELTFTENQDLLDKTKYEQELIGEPLDINLKDGWYQGVISENVIKIDDVTYNIKIPASKSRIENDKVQKVMIKSGAAYIFNSKKDQSDAVIAENNAKINENNKIIAKNIEIISLSQKNTVISNTNQNMSTQLKISSKEDIEANWDAFSKLDKASATSYYDLIISQELRKVSENYAKEKAEKDCAIAIAQEEVKKNSAAIKDFEAKLSEANKQLDAVRQAQAAATSEAKFQSRMAELDSEYDMDDEDKSCVAEDVKALADDDMDFAKFKKKFAVIAKEKSKAFKAKKQKELDDAKSVKADDSTDGVASKTKKDKEDKDAAEAAIAALASVTSSDADKIIAGGIDLTKKDDLLTAYASAFSPEKVVKQKTKK